LKDLPLITFTCYIIQKKIEIINNVVKEFFIYQKVCVVCVRVWERESVYARVSSCVRAFVHVCVCGREWVCVCMRVFVYKRERESSGEWWLCCCLLLDVKSKALQTIFSADFKLDLNKTDEAICWRFKFYTFFF